MFEYLYVYKVYVEIKYEGIDLIFNIGVDRSFRGDKDRVFMN